MILSKEMSKRLDAFWGNLGVELATTYAGAGADRLSQADLDEITMLTLETSIGTLIAKVESEIKATKKSLEKQFGTA